MKILITGSEGFIGQYLVKESLAKGHEVLGIDNLSKYKKQTSFRHPHYYFITGDILQPATLPYWMKEFKPDHFIINAALIGGIKYFHKYPYKIISKNERILASSFDAAIHAYKYMGLQKVTVLSSSMVYEGATKFPLSESSITTNSPPLSTYGFQKLAVHYFCKGAYEEHKLPYTIIIPFNAVGTGELDFYDGFSHVVPDLIYKLLNQSSDKNLQILGSGKQVRHYTYAGDLAKNIIKSLSMNECKNNTINISTKTSTTVIELAEQLMLKIHGTIFPIQHLDSYEYDVQKRIPDIFKAEQLDLTCNTTLNEMLDIVIDWMKREIASTK